MRLFQKREHREQREPGAQECPTCGARPSRGDTRGRVRNFVRLGLCGTPEDPASWALIVTHVARLYPDLVAGWAVIVLQEEFPDLYAAIVDAHGEFQPHHRRERSPQSNHAAQSQSTHNSRTRDAVGQSPRTAHSLANGPAAR